MNDTAQFPTWTKIRESKGIALEAIALQTHIPLRKLEALERHEFGELGDPTFIKGYIRSYAKILGENPEAFLQIYEESLEENTGQDLSAEQTMAIGVKRSGVLVRKINLLQISIAAIVVWVVFMFVVSKGEKAEPPLSLASEIEVEETEPESVSELPVGSETKVNTTPVLIEMSSSEEQSAIRDTQTPASSLVNGRATETDADRALQQDVLIFSFSEDCWVEVTDTSGSVLIAEEKRKGDNLRIFGQAPFNIMLGNARSVTLTINGRLVSTQPEGGNRTLRFSVSG